jgi:hypothetical protein
MQKVEGIATQPIHLAQKAGCIFVQNDGNE